MIIRFFILMVAFLCCTSAPAQNERGTMQRKNMPTRKSNRTPNTFRTPQRQDFNQNGSEIRRESFLKHLMTTQCMMWLKSCPPSLEESKVCNHGWGTTSAILPLPQTTASRDVSSYNASSRKTALSPSTKSHAELTHNLTRRLSGWLRRCPNGIRGSRTVKLSVPKEWL